MRETEVKSRLLASRPRWLETVGLVLVALFAGVWSVGAQEYRGTEEARAACTGDVFRLCWSEIPNVSHIVGCLAREKHQLSAGCRAVFDHHSNVRVAHDRWQKLHRFTSGSDQPQPGQLAPERHRDIATPSTEPMSAGRLATAADARTLGMPHVRSKAGLRSHGRSKLALRDTRAKHHHAMLVVGKQYRRRYHVHQG